MLKFLGAIILWVKTDFVFFNEMESKTSKDSTLKLKGTRVLKNMLWSLKEPGL